MKHYEFMIGGTFWCGGKEWRCTDIGTRVIVAIQISQLEVVESQDNHLEIIPMTGSEAEAQGWFNGPPYAVAENVFDEFDRAGCYLT